MNDGRQTARVASGHRAGAARRLRGAADRGSPDADVDRIKGAVDQRDLAALRGNRFEKLKGDRAGEYSIRINDQWRITFRIENNRALDVTIEDYH